MFKIPFLNYKIYFSYNSKTHFHLYIKYTKKDFYVKIKINQSEM